MNLEQRTTKAIEEINRLKHEAKFWEGRYRTQHKTVHALEDEIARLRSLLGTPNGTSVDADSDDPKNDGSKPEER